MAGYRAGIIGVSKLFYEPLSMCECVFNGVNTCPWTHPHREQLYVWPSHTTHKSWPLTEKLNLCITVLDIIYCFYMTTFATLCWYCACNAFCSVQKMSQSFSGRN